MDFEGGSGKHQKANKQKKKKPGEMSKTHFSGTDGNNSPNRKRSRKGTRVCVLGQAKRRKKTGEDGGTSGKEGIAWPRKNSFEGEKGVSPRNSRFSKKSKKAEMGKTVPGNRKKKWTLKKKEAPPGEPKVEGVLFQKKSSSRKEGRLGLWGFFGA